MTSWTPYGDRDEYARRVEYDDSSYSRSGGREYETYEVAPPPRYPPPTDEYADRDSYAPSGYGNSYATERDAYADGYAPAPAGYDNRYEQRSRGDDEPVFQQIYSRVLHHLLRPQRHEHHRPSFYSAYARAAHRYGFESGRFAGFAKRNNVVVKIAGLYDKSADHEVAATSIQNGEIHSPPCLLSAY